jgi:NADH-quinone oxidoreductase subunit N
MIRALSDLIALNLLHVGGILPEIILTAGIMLLLITDLLLPKKVLMRYGLGLPASITVGVCITAGAVLWRVWLQTPPETMDDLFSQTLFFDRKTLSAQMMILLGTVGVVLLSWVHQPLRQKTTIAQPRNGATEFYMMILGAVLGCMILVRANHWVLIYLALETVSLSSYVLTAFRRDDPRSAEASVKFFLYGSLASAVMLFGVSLQFGMTGSLLLSESTMPEGQPLSAVVFTYLLLLTGVGYKIALVPFHFWMPDAVEGASLPVSAFLSTVPKVAGFIWLTRWVQSTESLTNPMLPVLAVLAVVTMTWGNLSAYFQPSFKRMMAYSGIAHTGYLTAGVLTGSAHEDAILLYLFLYTIITIGAFASAEILASDHMKDWRGLGSKMPVPAFHLTISMLALTGLPPTIGFVAKLQLFIVLMTSGEKENLFIYLAIAIILNTVISLFYYLKPPTELIIRKRESSEAIALPQTPLLLNILCWVCSLVMIGGILLWGRL